jgi:DNA-directed RNA polymerase subunit RPC12/RpoP
VHVVPVLWRRSWCAILHARPMTHKIVPLEAVNALVTEPSTAYGIEEFTDVAVLDIKSETQDWGAGLDVLVDGCLVLGFTKIVLRLEQAEIASSFLVACIVSAWQRLIERAGTLVICGLTENAYKRLQELIDPNRFNIYKDIDACVDWLDSTYNRALEESFPRVVKCSECGAASQITNRGNYLCDECGRTYLVTERGELLF